MLLTGGETIELTGGGMIELMGGGMIELTGGVTIELTGGIIELSGGTIELTTDESTGGMLTGGVGIVRTVLLPVGGGRAEAIELMRDDSEGIGMGMPPPVEELLWPDGVGLPPPTLIGMDTGMETGIDTGMDTPPCEVGEL